MEIGICGVVLSSLSAGSKRSICACSGPQSAAPVDGADPAIPLAPAQTFIVTTHLDTDDSVCDGDCSFREAIKAAKRSASPVYLALANERAGRWLLANKREFPAQSYLREAAHWYAKWGAKAKLKTASRHSL